MQCGLGAVTLRVGRPVGVLSGFDLAGATHQAERDRDDERALQIPASIMHRVPRSLLGRNHPTRAYDKARIGTLSSRPAGCSHTLCYHRPPSSCPQPSRGRRATPGATRGFFAVHGRRFYEHRGIGIHTDSAQSVHRRQPGTGPRHVLRARGRVRVGAQALPGWHAWRLLVFLRRSAACGKTSILFQILDRRLGPESSGARGHAIDGDFQPSRLPRQDRRRDPRPQARSPRVDSPDFSSGSQSRRHLPAYIADIARRTRSASSSCSSTNTSCSRTIDLRRAGRGRELHILAA